MAALAYVLLPLSGLIAFLVGDVRARRHGVQAIALGAVWAAAIYLASSVSPLFTRAVFVAGAVVWLILLLATLIGRDLWLPGTRRLLRTLGD